MTETYFYNTFEKFGAFSRYPLTIPIDNTAIVGDHMVIDIVQKADFISALFLDMGPDITLANLEYLEILISRVVVWRFTGEYIHIYRMLRTPVQKQALLDNRIQIPITPFPILDEIQIRVKFTSPSGIVSPKNMSLTADFVYTGQHVQDGTYIIEQVQMSSQLNNLGFRHCVKELIVVVQDESQKGTLLFSNVLGGEQITNLKLQLNQSIKFNDTPAFFSKIQPMCKHTSSLDYVYVYPFCLEPENIKPTGTINMSRIQNQILTASLTDQNPKLIRVYAVSYNFLHVKNNLGTLEYIL